MDQVLQPLLTETRTVTAVWGGSRLPGWLGLPPPHPERLAEAWLVFDDNRIRNGDLAGRTLAEATRRLGAALVGRRPFRRYGADFPLLVKFLDTAGQLSVQVHPDDEYAHRHEAATGFHGKNEAWYVVDAAPDAWVARGLVRSVTRDELAGAIASQTLDRLLHRIPVAAGQTVLVRAGTIHTIGPGVMLYEIQQKSDLTYRVYDFGRTDPATGRARELHVAKALDVADLGPAEPTAAPVPLGPDRDLLAACGSFALERWTVGGRLDVASDEESLDILTVIGGALVVRSGHEPIHLARGGTVVIPAALGRYEITPAEGETAVVLRVHVPA
jgi:mannose-6-phosphate isomerase